MVKKCTEVFNDKRTVRQTIGPFGVKILDCWGPPFTKKKSYPYMFYVESVLFVHSPHH
jgi:hypothetical protein